AAVAPSDPPRRPALLVDAGQRGPRRYPADRGGQFGDLRLRGEVALEQDHPGAGIVLQPVALLRVEFGTGDADHEHGHGPRWMMSGIVAHSAPWMQGCPERAGCGRPAALTGRIRPTRW